jgi:heme-degrading monooxygenase HmoA
MPLISVTRLRIRSAWYLPAFFFYTLRAVRQARAATGNGAVQLLPDAHRTYWTCTQWTDLNAMRAYVASGAHRKSMKRLAHWCDEASVVHWEQADPELPGWDVAHRRMQKDGRPSKVNHPSAAHLAYQIPQPRFVTQAATAIADDSSE